MLRVCALIFAAAALGAPASAGQAQQPGGSPKQASEQPAAPLPGSTWVATHLNGLPVVEGVRLTITFGEGSSVTGNASCNNFRGTYTLDGTRLTFGGTIATRMACGAEVMRQETAFLSLLGAVERYEIDRDKSLVLRTSDKRDLTLVRK